MNLINLKSNASTYLANILVPYTTYLLYIRCALRDGFHRVSCDLKLILLVFRGFDVDTRLHDHLANNFFSEEVAIFRSAKCRLTDDLCWSLLPDFHLKEPSITILIDVDVDGEVSVDVTHLVLEPLGDTDYEVVDECLHSAKSSHIFPGSMVEFDVDGILVWVGEANSKML